MFSYRALSKGVGFSSPNTIGMVVNGKRKLSDAAIKKISTYLKFKRKESEYFYYLVMFNQAGSLDEKNKFFEQICYFKSYQEIHNVDYNAYQYWSKWYIPVIREMMFFKDFKSSIDWFGRKLGGKVSVDEIKEAFQVLRKLGLIKFGPKKQIIPTHKNVTSSNEVQSVSLLSFHQEMIRLAGESIVKTPREHRDISSVTIAIDQKSFKKVSAKLTEIREELTVDLGRASQGKEVVYQLNIQLFNLTRIPKSWDKS